MKKVNSLLLIVMLLVSSFSMAVSADETINNTNLAQGQKDFTVKKIKSY